MVNELIDLWFRVEYICLMKSKANPIQVFHNPRCGKCRTALEAFEKSGVKVVLTEYLKEPPSKKELLAVLAILDGAPGSLVRTKEEKYQEMQFSLNDVDVIATQLAKHPELIERPVIMNGTKAIIARTPESLQCALGL